MHPNNQQLSEFLLGRLDEEDRVEIERHIQDCQTCWSYLGTVADDDLVTLAKACDSKNVQVGQTDQVGTTDLQELGHNSSYRLLEKIGSGGMGDVYRAEHRIMGRTVAIKLVQKSLTGNPLAIQRFRNEVKSAARLTHPNIVTAFDAESMGETHFLVTEYIDGIDLAKKIQQDGPMDMRAAIDAMRQVAKGLDYAANQSMIHRDIKPQNLIIDRDGHVRILDFGLAKLVHENRLENSDMTGGLTAAHTTLGTPDFVAPEQAKDSRNADFRSDVYSLGCTLYFLITGNVPFPNCSPLEKISSHLLKEFPPLPVGVSETAASLLRKMVAKDPNSRFQSYQELIDALDHVSGENPTTVEITSQEKPLLDRRALLVGMGALSIVLITAAAWSAWGLGPLSLLTSRLGPPKVLYVIPNGVYLPDYLDSYQAFERAGATVSTTSKQKWVEPGDDQSAESLEVDLTLDEVDSREFNVVVFVGGNTWSLVSEDESGKDVFRIIRGIQKNGGIIAGICGGINVLAGHGMLDDKRYSDFPLELTAENATPVEQPVVADQTIVTTPDADNSDTFAQSILSLLNDDG